MVYRRSFHGTTHTHSLTHTHAHTDTFWEVWLKMQLCLHSAPLQWIHFHAAPQRPRHLLTICQHKLIPVTLTSHSNGHLPLPNVYNRGSLKHFSALFDNVRVTNMLLSICWSFRCSPWCGALSAARWSNWSFSAWEVTFLDTANSKKASVFQIKRLL